MNPTDSPPADPPADRFMMVAREIVDTVSARIGPPRDDSDVLVWQIGNYLSRKAPDMEDDLQVFEVARAIYDSYLDSAWDCVPNGVLTVPDDVSPRRYLLVHVAIAEPIASAARFLDLEVADPTDGPTRYPIPSAYLGLPIPDDFSTISDWLAASRTATVPCPFCRATAMTYVGAAWQPHGRFAADGWVNAYHRCRVCRLDAFGSCRTSPSAVMSLDEEIREEIWEGIER